MVEPSADRTRLVLLGASNLTRAFASLVHNARQWLGSPLEVYAALGHGRSYGMKASILFGARALPGIVECGLWNALETNHDSKNSAARSQSPIPATHALITDIGNDIMYGAQPQEIAHWVSTCIDRLKHHNAHITITMLPIDTIRTVSRWQFSVVKTIMFPTRAVTFAQAMQRADELHERIHDLAHQRGVTIVNSSSAWYGFDPIHIRRVHWPAAWGEILRCCAPRREGGHDAPRWHQPPFSLRAQLKLTQPQNWWLFAVPLGRPQPGRILKDGTPVFLF